MPQLAATVLRTTVSLCPECHSQTMRAVSSGESELSVLRDHEGTIEAQIVEEDGRVYMRKACPQHGQFLDLLAADAGFYKRMEALGALATPEPLGDEGLHNHGKFSLRYGNGTFIIFDLTNRCDMRCNPCFMNANAGQAVHELSLDDIRAILDRAAAVKDRREVNILFSGGEPTLSPHFLESVAYARLVGFDRPHVATNGIRFAQDPDFAKQAKHAGLHGVFLQIDGTTEASNAHRGLGNFVEVKTTALANIRAAGLQVQLQAAVVNGQNNHEVGALVQFAVDHGVFGLIFQPVMLTGRDAGITEDVRSNKRYTLSHLASDLAGQTRWDWQPMRDWFPISSFGLLGRLTDRLRGTNTSMVCAAAPISGVGSPLVLNTKTKDVVPLAQFFDVEGFLVDVGAILQGDLTGFELLMRVQRAIDARFRPETAPADFAVGAMYQLLEQAVARVNSGIEGWSERAYESAEWRLVIVNSMWFQDLFNLDLNTIQATTTVVATQEGEIPFCAYNSAGWREAVEAEHTTASLSQWHRENQRHAIYAKGQIISLAALMGVRR